MTRLSEVLTGANAGRHSARAIARLAQDRGHTLNHDTAARYLRGDHGTPDEVTLIAFSEVLGVPLRELRAAADLPSETTTAYVPPPESSRLTRRQRRAVDEVIRSMLEPTSSRSRSTPATVTDLPARQSGTGTSSRRAARHGEPEPPTD